MAYRSARLGSIAAALITSLSAATASANGQFPAADHIVVDPGDASHIVVRTTFGLLTSRDAGLAWDWMCETGVGYTNYEPAIEVTGDGSIIAGFLAGLGVTHGDSCGWALSGAPLDGEFVIDVSLYRATPEKSVAVTVQGGANISKVWSALDNGATWTQLGVDLPVKFLAKTLDVAPSDPTRIYVSGSDTTSGVLVGRVARSTDSGATWELFDVPGSGAGTAPYLAAVDPLNADTLYVRLDGAPGHLLVSKDAGETWTEIYTGTGFLKAFAISPDGATVLVGGDIDGVWRSTGGVPFEKVSDLGARCLKWATAGVYACADEGGDGFTIGLSKDMGSTYAPLLHLPCLRGPLACGATTSIGSTCPGEWPALATQIGAPELCVGEGGGGGASATTATGAGGGATTATGAGGGATTATAGGASCDDGTDEGCSYAPGGMSRDAAPALGLALLGLAAASMRRRRGAR